MLCQTVCKATYNDALAIGEAKDEFRASKTVNTETLHRDELVGQRTAAVNQLRGLRVGIVTAGRGESQSNSSDIGRRGRMV